MAKRCWLMKTEPESFGIHDLERVKIEPWSGVRNFMARNYMRDEMQVGDDVLFYHSNATPSGVAGLAVIHRTNVVDETQFEPSSKYFEPKAKRAAPIWICVDVSYVSTFPRLVALAELHDDPRLGGMLVTRKGMRLSVMPVEPAHFAVVVELSKRPPPGGEDGGGKGKKGKPAVAKGKPAVKAAASKPAASKPAAAKAAASKPAVAKAAKAKSSTVKPSSKAKPPATVKPAAKSAKASPARRAPAKAAPSRPTARRAAAAGRR